MLALDPCWLYLDLRLLSSGQRRASASVGALLVLSFCPESPGAGYFGKAETPIRHGD